MTKNNITNIIFLDVDGPLNTDKNKSNQFRLGLSISSYKIKLPKEQISNLKLITDVIDNTKLVLSSKWRLGGSPSEARLNLERQLYAYGLDIYSETPFCNFERGIEINTWLNDFKNIHGYKPPYIILDDYIDNIINYHKGHIVYCDSRFGLTDKEVNISINLLKKFRYEFFKFKNYEFFKHRGDDYYAL